MDMSSETKQAIVAVVAKQIIDALPTGARDELLSKSVADALQHYSVRDAIQEAVSLRAKDAIRELVANDSFVHRLQDVIRKSVDQFLIDMEKACQLTLVKFFVGEKGDSSYSTRTGVVYDALMQVMRERVK